MVSAMSVVVKTVGFAFCKIAWANRATVVHPSRDQPSLPIQDGRGGADPIKGPPTLTRVGR